LRSPRERRRGSSPTWIFVSYVLLPLVMRTV
jgi:hypothetical protein